MASAVRSSASSQEMRSNWPEPFGPLRRSGCMQPVGMMHALGIAGDLGADDAGRVAVVLGAVHAADQLPNLDLHLIVDNYATHKTPAVKRWLKRHARFHLHFTPMSGSWLNMVERFFAEITRKRIRRGVFKSVDELKQAIMDYLDNHNGHPKPYIWTKTATEIFSKVARAKQVLESQH